MILCRTHKYLEDIAAGLEKMGIPLLYLGDLFERPEIRDLLAILSFVSEPSRGGLYRIATLPEYRMPLLDVQAYLAFTMKHEKTPLAGLELIEEVQDITPAGRTALGALRKDIGTVSFATNPYTLLTQMLFDGSHVLRRYAIQNNAASQQQRLTCTEHFIFLEPKKMRCRRE